MISPAPSAIGSHPIGCNLDSHKLVFSDLADYTEEGLIRAKIYDLYPAFNGNASIYRVIVYSDTTGTSIPDPVPDGIATNALAHQVEVFPNPFQNQLVIRTSINTAKELSVQIYDVLGRAQRTQWLPEGRNELLVQTDRLLSGVYFLVITDHESGAVVL